MFSVPITWTDIIAALIVALVIAWVTAPAWNWPRGKQ